MIKCNYHELSCSADEWVWFIAFEMNRGLSSTAPALCVWQSWISQQTDVRQWYNEWLTQSVTWYFRMACFFSPGARAELSIVTWARGRIPIQRGQHSLSISLIVFNTTCFCHHTQGFGNFTKKMRLTENSHRIRLSLNRCICLTHRCYSQTFNWKNTEGHSYFS